MMVIEVDPVTLPRVSISPAIIPAFIKLLALFSEMTMVIMDEQQVSTERANPNTLQEPRIKTPKGYNALVNCTLMKSAIISKYDANLNISLSSNFFLRIEGIKADGSVKNVKRKKISPDKAQVWP